MKRSATKKHVGKAFLSGILVQDVVSLLIVGLVGFQLVGNVSYLLSGPGPGLGGIEYSINMIWGLLCVSVVAIALCGVHSLRAMAGKELSTFMRQAALIGYAAIGLLAMSFILFEAFFASNAASSTGLFVSFSFVLFSLVMCSLLLKEQ